jgi:hypothetical protein
MVGCIAALTLAVIYAIIRLYILSQRVDASVLVVNVLLFMGITGVLIYLAKKQRDIEEEELFRD